MQLLGEVDDSQLVWEFSPWVLRYHPQQGIKIFTLSSRKTPLNASTVLEFLSAFSESLRLPYLEHLVFKERNHEEKYHTTLAMMYLDTISELAVPGLASTPTRRLTNFTDQPLPSPNDHQGVLAEVYLLFICNAQSNNRRREQNWDAC